MAKHFPKLVKDSKLQIQEAQRTSNSIKTKPNQTSRYHFQTAEKQRQKIFKKREKTLPTEEQDKKYRTLLVRNQESKTTMELHQKLKEKYGRYRILYPVKLSSKSEEEIKTF